MKYAVLLLSLFSLNASAADLFDPPNGFYVAPAPYDRSLYGPSNSQANWHATQWNTPFNNLPAFNNGKTQNGSQRFIDNGNSWEIAQSGMHVACGKEFAAFAGTNKKNVYPAYPAAGQNSTLTLGNMEYLRHTIAVRPKYERVVNDRCAITQGGDLTAVIFKNTVNNNTFFYQLRLRTVENTRHGINWWPWNGPSWGFGDTLSSYGETPAVLGKRKFFDLDLLPRIKEIITTTNKGLDKNLDNWVVSGSYHGSHLWGSIITTAVWDSFSLSAE